MASRLYTRKERSIQRLIFPIALFTILMSLAVTSQSFALAVVSGQGSTAGVHTVFTVLAAVAFALAGHRYIKVVY